MTPQDLLVLVVDDDPAALHMISAVLEQAGFTAIVARDGKTALDLARRVTPDLVLLDGVMPGIDGFETCRRLKSGPDAIDAPVIFMTGLGEPADILRGLEAGGVDYVVKPINHDVLLARITIHALNARRMQLAARALDQSGRCVFAADADGAVLWASPGALTLLAGSERASPRAIVLSPAARQWLAAAASRPVSETPTLQAGDVRLTWLGRGRRGELMVQAHPLAAGDEAARLQGRFGLTAREAEVLLWLTAGKTNQEIAELLGLSRRTVDKHMEQVFAKMGVDNRTSAAILADRFLEPGRQ